MKRLRKKIGIFVCALFLSFVPFFAIHAHELLPAEVTAYLDAHPNATPEEIKEYAESQAPEFAAKFRDGAEILRIAQNQETTFLDTMIDFLRLGVRHILGGADHVLFVLSLLLVFVSWRDILKLTGTFTVAHSITLVLAGQGIVTLSSRIVEPFIAFSIAAMAFTSVFLAGTKFVGENHGKLSMVFFFGLFHGLGFAGLLREIQVPADKFISSLFSFNVGIELGQVFIVLCASPFIYFFREKPWYPQVIKILAMGIIALGTVWGVERIVG